MSVRVMVGHIASPGDTVVHRPEGARLVSRGSDFAVWSLGAATAQTINGPDWRAVAWGDRVPDRRSLAKAAARFASTFDPRTVAPLAINGVMVVHSPPVSLICPDPVGNSPVFYTLAGHGVVFASHGAVLSSLVGGRRDLDWLVSWLAAPAGRTPHTNASPWPRVCRIGPGRMLVVHSDGAVKQVNQPLAIPEHDEGEHVELLRDRLCGAVAARTTGRMSADLSGGFDSTTVAGIAVEKTTLTTATLIPPGEACDDVAYARVAAEAFGTVHHEWGLTSAVDPFTAANRAPVTDEPFSDLVNHARLGWWFTRVAEFGTGVHLTGTGADAVVLAPPSYLADLAAARRWPTLWRHAAGWARLRHQPLARLLVNAVRAARLGPDRQLADHITALRAPAPDRSESAWSNHVAYVETSPLAAWLTHEGRGVLADALAADPGPPEIGLSGSDAVALEMVRESAAAHRCEVDIADAHGFRLAAPFLDADVVAAFLAVPAEQRTSPTRQKPALAEVAASWLPEPIRHRSTKGDYTSLAYRGVANAADELRDVIASSRLADAGLVDLDPVLHTLATAATGVRAPVPALARFLAAESWLRRPPPPVTWSTITVSELEELPCPLSSHPVPVTPTYPTAARSS